MAGPRSYCSTLLSMHSVRPLLAGIVALALAGAAAPLSAQLIHGRLLQEGTLAPLTGASVQLLDAQGNELNRLVTTNEAGTFAMRVEPGRYTLRIRRIGFQPLVTPAISLAANEVFEGTYRISPVTVRLATERITAKRNLEWGRDGFARRKALGQGLFLTRNDLKDKDQRDFASLLQGVEGVQVQGYGRIISTEGWRCLYFMVNQVLVSSVPGGVVGAATYPTLEDLVPTGHDVMAIEVYREFKEVPPEFRLDAWPGSAGLKDPRAKPSTGVQGSRRQQDTPCGLISVWTRAAW